MSTYHTCTTVSLLKRPITNGRISLYLDFYPAIRNPETMKMTRREYLGIYIYAKPNNSMEREFNRQMLEKAEAIQYLRITSLINEKFDFLVTNNRLVVLEGYAINYAGGVTTQATLTTNQNWTNIDHKREVTVTITQTTDE